MEGGALGIVLRISRVVGVAPFLEEAEYRVSQSLMILAKLFILITAIDFVVTFASSSNLFLHKYESLIIFDILAMLSKFVVIITTLVSVFTAPGRAIRLLQFIKQLDQIDKNIVEDPLQFGNEIFLTLLIFIYLHVCLVLRVYNMNIERTNETILRFLFVINHYMITLSALQIGLFARRTMISLKVINISLEKLFKKEPIKDTSSRKSKTRVKPVILAWEKEKQQSWNITQKQGRLVKTRLENMEEPVKLIRQCIKNYLNVCDITTASMDGDGLLIMFLLMLNIIDLLTHSYNVAVYVFVSDSYFNEREVYDNVFWCIAYFLSVIIFMDPYHKTQVEDQMKDIEPNVHNLFFSFLTYCLYSQSLQFLLMSLKWISLDDVDINNELHLFGRVINVNKPRNSPLGMFTLNRLLVLKIFGSLVTYLVIMITYVTP